MFYFLIKDSTFCSDSISGALIFHEDTKLSPRQNPPFLGQFGAVGFFVFYQRQPLVKNKRASNESDARLRFSLFYVTRHKGRCHD